MFNKAIKEKLKAKVMMDGPSGSGKTLSALLLARGLVGPKGKIALLDTENRSASIYADRHEFDVCDLKAPFTPEAYIAIINGAVGTYDALIIDSMSHEWNGQGGILEIKEKLGDGFHHWKTITPRHNKFVSAIINADIHIITTLRSKTGYVMGENSNGGKSVTKMGLQPITRDGFEYENTVVFSINENHMATCKKDRTSLFNEHDFTITEETGEKLLAFLDDGQSLEDTLKEITKRCKGIKGLSDWGEVKESLLSDGLLKKPEQTEHIKQLFAIWTEETREKTPEELQIAFDKMVKECNSVTKLKKLQKFYEDNLDLVSDFNQDELLRIESDLKGGK